MSLSVRTRIALIAVLVLAAELLLLQPGSLAQKAAEFLARDITFKIVAVAMAVAVFGVLLHVGGRLVVVVLALLTLWPLVPLLDEAVRSATGLAQSGVVGVRTAAFGLIAPCLYILLVRAEHSRA